MKNIAILRFEALALFLGSLFLYNKLGFSWWLFGGLFLIPDIGLAGYTFGNKIGALLYNILHTEVLPLTFFAVAYIQGMPEFYPYAITWFCHINFDRFLGIGLKETNGFKHTHLGQI